MAKIRGWYKGDDGQMHEMEGTEDERGVVTFPHAPSGGILIEGVDMSGISPVYMTPENPAREEIPAQEGNLPIDTLEDLLDHYYEIRRTGWRNNPPRKEILERFAALEANQITPEMIALWQEYQAMGADEYLYHAERFKGRLWQMFAAKMGGGE